MAASEFTIPKLDRKEAQALGRALFAADQALAESNGGTVDIECDGVCMIARIELSCCIGEEADGK